VGVLAGGVCRLVAPGGVSLGLQDGQHSGDAKRRRKPLICKVCETPQSTVFLVSRESLKPNKINKIGRLNPMHGVQGVEGSNPSVRPNKTRG
jgi:hypothetical protein